MCHRILVDNDQYIPLTVSLYNALRDLGLSEGSRTLWADAICINQQKIRERSQRVSTMGSISLATSRVVTYIGEDSEDSFEGLLLMQKLAQYYNIHCHQEVDDRIQDVERYGEFGFPDVQHPNWKTLRSVVTRPWSTRTRIVQGSILNEM
jgi:hypothetical protein